MSILISSIHYSPVKSLSFENIESCKVEKNLGILNDRIFAFSRIIDAEKAKLIEKNPNERKLNNFLPWFHKEKELISPQKQITILNIFCKQILLQKQLLALQHPVLLSC